MSQENVELSYRAYDAFNRRDLDAFLGLMDPEVTFTSRFGQMEGEPHYQGHNGIREWWEDLLGIFPNLSFEILEAGDLGDVVIGNVRIRGHGLDSDAPVDQTLWTAGEWRNGMVVWWQTFGSESEALEAVGLSE